MSDERSAFDAASARDVGLWDEMPLWSALAGQHLLEHVPLTARRALDLGSGTGFPLLELAERLGPEAHVVGVDPWRAAMRRAAEKRAAWPVPNASLVLADGARLPLRDGAFDLVVSNLGVNNFAGPDAAFAECRRVLAAKGTLAISTNLSGHFRELYAVFEQLLARRGDREALARLEAHVAHRGTLEGLCTTLARHGFEVTASHLRDATWGFHDGAALLSHHFIRLGFLPAWREVAGEANADEVLCELQGALDAHAHAHGGLRLSIPLVVLVARAG